MAARVFHRATAGAAKRFPDGLADTLPFPPRSIQVDGGSEFMGEFEDACQRFHHQVRPHQALDFMTPDEYLRNNK